MKQDEDHGMRNLVIFWSFMLGFGFMWTGWPPLSMVGLVLFAGSLVTIGVIWVRQ